MVKKYVELEQLSEAGFIGERSGDSLTIKPRISAARGNLLTLANDGLRVSGVQGYTKHIITPTTSRISVSSQNRDDRMVLMLNGATHVGLVHLDFTCTTSTRSAGDIIARLPNNAPTPLHLIEEMVDIGSDVRCWVNPGGRDIYLAGGARNQRYIINIMGFF